MSDKKTIVIVDDDPHLLRLVSSSLQSQGYDVVEFKNGTDALNYFKQGTQISLLILDRILPDMDGIEILKTLANQNKNGFPVLILSSLSSEKDVLEGLSKGAVDYISKPFNMNVLLQKAKKMAGS